MAILGSTNDIIKWCNFVQHIMPSRIVYLADIAAMESRGCLLITIAGLNKKVVVNTLLPIPVQVTAVDVRLCDLLQGACHCDSNRTGVPVTMEMINYIVRSSFRLHQERMLFVLDVYSHGQDQVEFVVNRGFQVNAT